MPDYRLMPLDQQLVLLLQEQVNSPLLYAKAQMWGNATMMLNQSGELIERETDKIEPAWKDDAGVGFVARARDTRRTLAEWAGNIQDARPDRPLVELSTLIPHALDIATKNKIAFDEFWLTSGYAISTYGTQTKAEVERQYAEPSGKLLNQIAELYRQAGDAVKAATEGRNIGETPYDPTIPGGAGGGGTGGVGAGGGGGIPAGIAAGGGGTGGIPGGLPTGGGGGGVSPIDGVPPTGVDTIGDGGGAGGGAGGVPPTSGGPSPIDGIPPTGVDTIGGGGAGGADQNPELSGGLGTAPITSPGLAGGGGGLPVGTGGTSTIPPISPITGGIGGIGGGSTGTRPVGGGTTPIGGGPGGGGGGTGIGPITGGSGIGTGGSGIGPITGGSGVGPITGGGLGGGPITGIGAGNGNSSGNGSTAGVKVPGVSLGGLGPIGGGGGGLGGGIGGLGGTTSSGTTIPTAAAPYQTPAAPAPSAAAPTTPPLTAAGASSTGAGTGGMPMMPPMGMGGGTGGAGNGPGSGAAARARNNGRNRRKEEVTPGLPVMLSGKAGQADMNAFTGRGRKQVEESDVPTTVQLIDEDLWQVEQKQTTDERVAAPVRRAH